MYLRVTTLVIVLYLSAISCYIDSLPSGIHYVGCYTTAFARQNENGLEISPMTWEVCIRLCIEKDSRYAGVESAKSTCYCGNNLAQQSEKVAPYMCDEECYADKSRTCGGDDDLLSLYQIKNTSSFSFLVTTDNGLAYFKNNRLTANFASLPRVSTIKAAYHYAENAVYFYANKKIYRSQYIPLLTRHINHQELVELREEASSLALDWVNYNLYWALHHSIVESNLDGSNRKEIVRTDHPAMDLTVDPYDRHLFFISNGTIKRFDHKSNKIGNDNLLRDNRFQLVTNMAVDLHKKLVYAIGYYEYRKDGDKHLVSTDYDGVMFRVLLRRRELTGAFSLSALNDQLFWAEFTRGNQRTLYSYKVPTTSVLARANKMSSLPKNVVGTVLYHEDAQTRGETYFCQKLKCSHTCTYTLATSAKCDCPKLMTLGRDHRTCKDIPGLKQIEREVETSDEFDDEIFNISIDLPRRDKSKSREKKPRKKKDKKRGRSRKSRKRGKQNLNSRNSTSKRKKIKSRSFPLITVLNGTNFTSVNTTT